MYRAQCQVCKWDGMFLTRKDASYAMADHVNIFTDHMVNGYRPGEVSPFSVHWGRHHPEAMKV